MYSVTLDRSRTLVCLVAAGFFSMEDLESAAAELLAAIRSLGPQIGEHVILFDYTDIQVAQPAVLERFGRYFTEADTRPLLARRIAFVNKSALVGMQLKRIKREHMRIFTDRQEATTWLLDDQDRVRTISQPTAASG